MKIETREIQELLAEILQRPAEELDTESNLAELGCDSISVMKLQMQMMRKFRVRVMLEEMQDSSISSVTALIREKLAQKE